MNMQQTAAKEYLERQIMNASPTERVVLCYDGAIRFLLRAKKAIEEKNIEARYVNNKKAGNVIGYLMDTLDMEKGGEVAKQLRYIYSRMTVRLMDVDIYNDTAAIDEVVGELRQLRASWEQISRGEGPGSKGDVEADKNAKKVTATA